MVLNLVEEIDFRSRGMAGKLDNANPVIFEQSKERQVLPEEEDDDICDKIDDREIFGNFKIKPRVVS